MYEKTLIAQIGDPILRKKTFEVKPNTILSKRVQNIIKNLIFVMMFQIIQFYLTITKN